MLNSPLEQSQITDYLHLTIFNLDFLFTTSLFINLLASLFFRSFIFSNSSKKNYKQTLFPRSPSVVLPVNPNPGQDDLYDVLFAQVRTSYIRKDCVIPYFDQLGSILPMDCHFFEELNSVLGDDDANDSATLKSIQRNLASGIHDTRLFNRFAEWADGPTRAFVRRLLVGDFNTFEKAMPIINILILGSIGVTDPSVVVKELFNELVRIEYAPATLTAAVVEPDVELGANFFPRFDPQEHSIMTIRYM